MRQLLNRRQIRALRSVANLALPDSCTLRNPGAVTRGSGGGVVKNPTPVDTAARGRLEPLGFQSGDVQDVAGRLQLKNPYVWVFASNQSHLSTETKIVSNSRTFLVRAVMETGAWGMVKRAIVDEV